MARGGGISVTARVSVGPEVAASILFVLALLILRLYFIVLTSTEFCIAPTILTKNT